MSDTRPPEARAFQDVATMLGLEIANHAVTRARLADALADNQSKPETEHDLNIR